MKQQASQRNINLRRCIKVDSKREKAVYFFLTALLITAIVFEQRKEGSFLLESEVFPPGRLPPPAVIVSTSICVQDDNCLFFNLPKEFHNGVVKPQT
jgi:hypothetical protein